MVKPDFEPRRINRRNFLKIGVATTGAIVLATTDLGSTLETVETIANRIGSLASVSNKPSRIAESAQYSQIHIEFDIDKDHYAWDITGAGWGINPPNDSSIRIGTVRVAVNNIWDASRSFQPLEKLYPPDQYAIVIGGMAVEVSLDKYYLGTGIGRNDGNYDPYFELGTGIKNAENYTGRIVIQKGLPLGGIKGSMYSSLVILGSDNTGNYLDYIFSDCINSSENGTYRIQRDNLGNLIGDTFVKISDSITPGKPFRVVLSEYMQNAQQ